MPDASPAIGTIPATHPQTEEVLREVFLSPRVVDRRAFEDYAGSLKALIRDASGAQSTLSAATTDVKGLRESLRDATKDLQSKLEAALKVLPPLNERVTRAEQLAAMASDPAKLAEQIKDRLQGLLSAKAEEIEQLAERMVGEVLTRIEQRRGELARADQALDAKLARTLETIDQRQQQMLATIEARELQMVDAIAQAQTQTLAKLEAREAKALDAIVAEQGKAAESQALIAAATAELESLARRRVTDLEEQAAALLARSADDISQNELRLARRLDDTARQLDTKLEAARGDAERIERLLAQRVIAAEAQHSAMLRHERDVQDRLVTVFKSAEDRLTPLRDLVDRDLKELDKRLRRVRLEVEAAGGPGLQHLEELCAAVGRILGPTLAAKAGLPIPQGEHTDLIAHVGSRVAQFQKDLPALHAEVAQLAQQATIARQGLSQSILDGATQLDDLSTRCEAIERRMQELALGTVSLREVVARK